MEVKFHGKQNRFRVAKRSFVGPKGRMKEVVMEATTASDVALFLTLDKSECDSIVFRGIVFKRTEYHKVRLTEDFDEALRYVKAKIENSSRRILKCLNRGVRHYSPGRRPTLRRSRCHG